MAQALVALSQLAIADGPAVAEAEVNPLIVRPKGEGVVAVDALGEIRVGDRHDRTHSGPGEFRRQPRAARALSQHDFMLEIGDKGYLVKIIEGRIVGITPGPFVTPNYSFALRAPRDEWELFWKKVPAPGHNDIFALFKRGKLTIEGDLHPFMANLLYIKDVLAAPRKEAVQ
jgi:hypothetical protein